MASMPWNELFPHTLRKKISKTAEGRTGKGIYKRRNSRSYRVVMHLETYKRIVEKNHSLLEKFESGYAVRVKPSEYFPHKTLPYGLKLGESAFIYYKSGKDYRDFPPDPSWNEVLELYTSGDSRKGPKEWVGEYACFINNAKPPRVSQICSVGEDLPKELEAYLQKTYRLAKVPKQAGLGNFDYDFASSKMIDDVEYQLAYLILSVKGIDKTLYEQCMDPEQIEPYPEKAMQYAKLGEKEFIKYVQDVKREVETYCVQNKLLDFDKLEKVRAWSKARQEPICPLCLSTLDPNDFFETVQQAEGKEEEDNTTAAIALMHIKALAPGELNHCTYNLGWGHRHCNTIQGEHDIAEVLDALERILKANNYSVKKND